MDADGRRTAYGRATGAVIGRLAALVGCVLCIVASGCTDAAPSSSATPPGSSPAAPPSSSPQTSQAPRRLSHMPRLAHVVVVIMENHSAGEVLHNPAAPFLESLTKSGLSLTDMHALTHPSQPNYLVLFSGSTHGVTSDACPVDLSGPNLASALHAKGFGFVGYSESLPAAGYRGCSAGEYARKHNPWVDFRNVPAAVNQPMAHFPRDYSRLPTVSFVVPNLDHDMHDGTIGQADTWLHKHLGRFVGWAPRHRSLLVVTWDENDGAAGNHIATVMSGAGVRPGTDGQHLTHLSLLRTLEDAYGLAHLGATRGARPITGHWQTP